MEFTPEQLGMIPESAFRELNYDTSSLFIIMGTMNPPNGAEFARHIEWTHYIPDTPANNDFNVYLHNWRHTHPWWIIRMPLRDRAFADAACEKFGLRLANGVPHLMQQGGLTILANVRKPPPGLTLEAVFPLNSRRAFGLERKHPGNGPVPSGIMIEQPNATAAVMDELIANNDRVLRGVLRRHAERN